MPPEPRAPLEIERVYLLRAMPPLPAGAVALRLEQGYLRRDGSEDLSATDPGNPGAIREGRIRRITHPGGRIECVHTVKTGVGRVRTEIEKSITPEQFAQAWPHTEGCRIRKTRHRVPHGSLVWEIDRFDDLELVLAEVELPAADTPVEVPPWLASFVVREVTDEPEYRNYSLAMKLGLRERHRK